MIKKSFSILYLLSLLLPASVLADSLEYKLAAPIPGGQDTATDFNAYMGYLFPFLLSIAAISALIMFVYGGIEYASAGGSEDRTKSAKERISNALLGLLLAVGSVLIMQTINPELIKLDLKIKDIQDIVGPGNNPGTGTGNNPGTGTGGNVVNGSSCDSSSSCQSGACGLSGNSPANEGKKCLPSGLNAGDACDINEQCTTGVCDQRGLNQRKYCQSN